MVRKFNFAAISALVVDPDRFSTGIINNILRGFGLSDIVCAEDGRSAQKLLPGGRFHLLIVENRLPDMALSDLVAWIRRSPKDELRFLPVIVLTGYTQHSQVLSARDAGVNSVVAKPVSPNVLFDHVVWSSKNERPFIDASAYSGPDRRFRSGERDGSQARRLGDLSAAAGDALEAVAGNAEL